MMNIQDIQSFIKFAMKELKLTSTPTVKFVGKSENKFDSIGHSQGRMIVIRTTDRHPVDVMRGAAHDLIRYKQNTFGNHVNKKEDQANSVVDRILRKFDTEHPNVLRDKANMVMEDGLTAAAVNATGPAVQGFDPMLGGRKRPLRRIIRRKRQ